LKGAISMNIYSTRICPYVYVCTHKLTGHYYIGYRSANSIPSDLDLPKYKTSSLTVKPDFENYNWQIIAEFFNGDDAYDFEQQLISENWHDPLLLNKQHRYQCNGRFKTKPGRIISDKTKEKIRSKRALQIITEETKEKMSQSIRDAKGTVSDETILKVRNLLQSGKSNNEIQELLSLPRHTVSRIKNGNIVCRNEKKQEKKSLTQEEINLSKRKINTDEIIIVIERFIEKWKPVQILDYLIERRNKKNIVNNLTIDIIKNIKRNLKNGKRVIYESELLKENYEYYIKILKQLKDLSV